MTSTAAPPSADKLEIRRGLSLLVEPGSVFEIRALGIPGRGKPHTASAYCDNLNAGVTFVSYMDKQQAAGVYVLLNPAVPGVFARSPNKLTSYPQHTTTDAEVIRRRWLFVDIDPDRPAGVAATDEERQTAIDLACDLETKLKDHGFPEPVSLDSGNGLYLLYRIDEPNDQATTELLRRFYAGLNTLAGWIDPNKPHAIIDASVYNAARIARVPGTTNRKGHATPDRPHRQCSMGEPPDPLVVVERAAIERVAALAPQDPSRSRASGNGSPTRDTRRPRVAVGRYLAGRQIAYREKPGKVCTFYNLDACLFDEQHGKRGESAICQGDNGLITYHCMHDGCSDRRWSDVVNVLGKPEPDEFDPPLAWAKPSDNGTTKQAAGGAEGDAGPQEPPRFATVLTSAELAVAGFSQEYLIEDLMVAGQPGVFGGRAKTLKTAIAEDAAISLGSGKPFLGRFKTSRKVNVGFWSGESGGRVIQDRARLIAEARGVDLADCSVVWSFDLPKLGRASHLETMAAVIQQHALEVVIVDPLYLSLLDPTDTGRTSDLFYMGSKLFPLTELAQSLGVTFWVCHHFRKTAQPDIDEPAGLEELAQSGVCEWARAWCLLERREPYNGDGRHALWCRLGGSAGHGGLWGLTIDEGTHADGRKWEVEVSPVSDARAEARRERENRKAVEAEKREGEAADRLRVAMRAHPEGETKSVLRAEAGLNDKQFARALAWLRKDGIVENVEIKKGRGVYDGFRLP